MAAVALEFATQSRAEADRDRQCLLNHAEPDGLKGMVDIRGYHAAAKVEPPKVFIKGKLRAKLREIFNRVPHVAATNAHKEITEDPANINNMWVRYNISEDRCKRLFAAWKKARGDNKGQTFM